MNRGMKTVFKIAICLVLFVFLISAAGCGSSGKVKVMPAMLTKPDLKQKDYKVTVAETRTIDTYLSVDALISYDTTADLSFKIDYCHLKGVYVEKDDNVVEGQLLAELDASDLENRLAARQIDLERAQLKYNRLLSQPDTENPGRNTELENLKLDMESINLDIGRITESISETKLVAPFSGIITELRDYELGEWVQSYNKLMTLCKPDSFIIQSKVLNGGGDSSTDLSGLVTGMKVSIMHGSGKTLTEIPATVTQIVNTDPGILPNPSRILAAATQLRIYVKPDGDYPDKLFVNRTITLKIYTGKLENVVVLPKTAIRGYGANDQMVSVVKGEKIITRRISTGYEDTGENIVVITSGLRPGESVIMN